MNRVILSALMIVVFILFYPLKVASQTTVTTFGLTVEEVAAKVEAAGLTVDIDTTGDGAIFGETLGFNFALLAFDCDGSSNRCRDFVFNAYFETDSKITEKALNDYNANAIAGRAYIDTEGDATLEHFFSVHDANDDLVERNLEIWQSILPDFAAFIGAYGDSAGS